MTEVLSSSELKGLKEHKYSVVCNTLLDPLMQVYWRWLVDLLPMWWAPNAITLAGLLVNIVTTLILIMYSPDAKQEVCISFFVVDTKVSSAIYSCIGLCTTLSVGLDATGYALVGLAQSVLRPKLNVQSFYMTKTCHIVLWAWFRPLSAKAVASSK